jgi:hypothetical protein
MKQKFSFCDDLDAPELCIIIDPKWFHDNADEIMSSEGVEAGIGAMLLIPKPEDRMTFVLRWA